MTRICDPDLRPKTDDQPDTARRKLHARREASRALEVPAVAPHMRAKRRTGNAEHQFAPTERRVATHDGHQPWRAAGAKNGLNAARRSAEAAGRPLTRFQWVGPRRGLIKASLPQDDVAHPRVTVCRPDRLGLPPPEGRAGRRPGSVEEIPSERSSRCRNGSTTGRPGGPVSGISRRLGVVSIAERLSNASAGSGRRCSWSIATEGRGPRSPRVFRAVSATSTFDAR